MKEPAPSSVGDEPAPLVLIALIQVRREIGTRDKDRGRGILVRLNSKIGKKELGVGLGRVRIWLRLRCLGCSSIID